MLLMQLPPLPPLLPPPLPLPPLLLLPLAAAGDGPSACTGDQSAPRCRCLLLPSPLLLLPRWCRRCRRCCRCVSVLVECLGMSSRCCIGRMLGDEFTLLLLLLPPPLPPPSAVLFCRGKRCPFFERALFGDCPRST